MIDTILDVVSNGAIITGTSTGPNEQALRDAFPFFPSKHQPFVPGTLDDRTHN
ncbi:MAG: hypothetical protein ACR2M4_05890 [Actinomycetota bacterium]